MGMNTIMIVKLKFVHRFPICAIETKYSHTTLRVFQYKLSPLCLTRNIPLIFRSFFTCYFKTRQCQLHMPVHHLVVFSNTENSNRHTVTTIVQPYSAFHDFNGLTV